MSSRSGRLHSLVESAPFHRAALSLILANAALMGLETSPAITAQWQALWR